MFSYIWRKKSIHPYQKTAAAANWMVHLAILRFRCEAMYLFKCSSVIMSALLVLTVAPAGHIYRHCPDRLQQPPAATRRQVLPPSVVKATLLLRDPIISISVSVIIKTEKCKPTRFHRCQIAVPHNEIVNT